MSAELDRLHACKDAIRNPITFPGGYIVGIYLETGGRICPGCARECWPDIVGATLGHPTKGCHGWAVIGVGVHWEGDPESCCECGAELASEYGPVPDDSDAIVDDHGGFTLTDDHGNHL